ncbi:MAG: LON peptidase substrate-binding domain-containing protein [Comamonas sp.]|uniref:LON peptidase substrate-binding domain-containing protein n=1 Tax=Comamonas sp. TaxID=34028 RepID=UPI002FC70CE6
MTLPLTLTSLPLFPLGSVLFPGGRLPLRVFEVRYLDMVRKCARAGAPFGVVALSDGHEVRHAGAPPERFHAVGTLATIAQLQFPQAGLMHVLCQGTQRFRIRERRCLPHGLWVADVEMIDADLAVPVPEDLQAAAQALDKLLHTLRSQHADDPGLALPDVLHLNDCGWVANRWCELLPLPTTLRQQLMELENPLVRLELVADVLERTGIGF